MVSLHEFCKGLLYRRCWINRERKRAISTKPFLKGVGHQLVLGNAQKFTLFSQPFELKWTDHDVQRPGLIRFLR